jgi:hypothetical protein
MTMVKKGIVSWRHDISGYANRTFTKSLTRLPRSPETATGTIHPFALFDRLQRSDLNVSEYTKIRKNFKIILDMPL